MFGWLGWFDGWLVWLVGWLFCWLVGSLVGWFVMLVCCVDWVGWFGFVFLRGERERERK